MPVTTISYGTEVRERILGLLADGKSLLWICQQPGMPARKTVTEWAAEPTWGAEYRHARALGIEALVDEATEIADNASNDTMLTESGERADTEWIARSKLRVEQRRWMAAKLLPHVYGDKTQLQMLDEHGKPAKAGITIIVDGAPGE